MLKYIAPSKQRARPYRWHEIREITYTPYYGCNEEPFHWVGANIPFGDYMVGLDLAPNYVRISFLFRRKSDAMKFKMVWHDV